MLIFHSKTGVNPVYSKWNPIARQSWAAYKFLRENHCDRARIDSAKGGHHRKPAKAYGFWLKHQKQIRRPRVDE